MKRKKSRKPSRKSHGSTRRRAAHNPRSAYARKGRRPRRRRKNDGTALLKSVAIAGVVGGVTLIAIDAAESRGIIPASIVSDPIKHGLVLTGVGLIGGYALYKKSPEAALGLGGAAIGFGTFAAGQGLMAKAAAADKPAPQAQPAPAAMRNMGAIEERRRQLRGLGAIENVYRREAMARLGRIQFAGRRAA